jgi:hypothetical protein
MSRLCALFVLGSVGLLDVALLADGLGRIGGRGFGRILGGEAKTGL